MKYIPYFIFVFICYVMIANVLKEKDIIPKESIRIRVIANSNSNYDQEVKKSVKNILTNDMSSLLKNVSDFDEARLIINNNLPKIDANIENFLTKNNYNTKYDINFGYNYFPKKEYKGIKYKAGYYESLVVTLGEGKGDNWWCVLFPPICLIEAEESEEVEYTTLVREIFSKYS